MKRDIEFLKLENNLRRKYQYYENKSFIPKLIVISLLGILLISLLLFLVFTTNTTKICDIGNPKVAGDYKDRTHDCAVEDCVAFNKYQEEINGKTRCVV